MSKEEEIPGMREFGKQLAAKIDARKKMLELKKQRAESQARRDATKKNT